MKRKAPTLLDKPGVRSVAASVLSILFGLVVGSLVVLIVGLTGKNMSVKAAWDGIRLIFIGIFSTGRNAAGGLTFGFNPQSFGNMLFRATPLIMTGLSVAVAFKTGLFNIGAPGQYLMGTLVTLCIALGIPPTWCLPRLSGSWPLWAVCWQAPSGALSPAC